MSATTQIAAPEQAQWTPSANPWAIAAAVMTATFMVVLDSSVANVALPHIAGNLSASNDEATWVLTSYLVSNAIMLPATGWISRRIGRKRLLMLSILIFTGASMLCGAAITMPMLIVARILQGIGGGGMQPLAQAILLESFPPTQHGKAMAVYGTGIVVAPVIGPTLGGWITDSYSWRWIFYINLPVGVLAFFLAGMFVEDPPYLKAAFRGAIDALGFGLMALWLGTLQLVLDKGQEADWFEADWIRWTLAVSVIAFVGFIVRELKVREPIVQLHVLLNRNFTVGTIVTGIYGFVLYASTALLPLFLQTLLGYSAFDSGLAVSPRGFGSIASMIVAGMIASRIDGRWMLMFGFFVFGVSTLMLSRLNLGIGMASVIVPNILNGFAGGFVFVPLTTMAMGRLQRQEIGNAAGIYNLVRNIGGSVGIATATALLVRRSQIHQNYLAGSISATDPVANGAAAGFASAMHSAGADAVTAHQMALGALYRSLQQQALLMSYVDAFRLLGYLALLCIPFILLFQAVRKPTGRSISIEE
ncbi:DHA2 family efflux MFS transporter permease subunit [Occallatibacter riparius]|uniref:DHA2 family efflux MFS transporter permease subunit n=1 Tax=Occallatibacter riparius TaxID=1002689 RepID=A0A9J7BU47_9BACT|nr:DHA2 family efflux MFS transporter permease subunit [Occallatibacter riparius]UWZ84509.1 DHA2 family efflux MFS transporter permease subunit [Occallatibacter riparius]